MKIFNKSILIFCTALILAFSFTTCENSLSGGESILTINLAGGDGKSAAPPIESIIRNTEFLVSLKNTSGEIIKRSFTGQTTARLPISAGFYEVSMEAKYKGHTYAETLYPVTTEVVAGAKDNVVIVTLKYDEKGMIIIPQSGTVKAGSSIRFEAIVFGAGVTDQTVTWSSSSSNPAVSFSPVSGADITTLSIPNNAEGTITITAVSTNHSPASTGYSGMASAEIIVANSAFTVTFNSNGGSAVSPITVTFGASLGTLLTNPTRTSYIFDYWYDDDGNTFTASTPVTEDIEVTAQWNADPDSTAFTVINTADWNSVLSVIQGYGTDESYTITVAPSSADGIILVPGSTAVGTSFGNVTGVSVTLNGTGKLKLSSNGSVLNVGPNQTLIIDSSGLVLEGRMTANGDAANNNRALIYLSGTAVNYATLQLKAGKLTGNYGGGNSTGGGGVYVGSSTNFTMTGGEISGNSFMGTGSNNGGGGVGVYGGTFNISGGAVISDNTAANGGGVFVNGGTVTMFGSAQIIGNTARSGDTFGGGGGVFISSGTFNMSAGTISGNTANDSATNPAYNLGFGGGVNVYGGTFNLTGGTVYGSGAGANSNFADSGGASLYVGGSGTANVNGISINTTENNLP